MQKEPLPSTFACLFCNHENSVVIKLDKKLGLGNLSCKVCGQRYQTGINCE
jgi:transcription elongation factor Elf1